MKLCIITSNTKRHTLEFFFFLGETKVFADIFPLNAHSILKLFRCFKTLQNRFNIIT